MPVELYHHREHGPVQHRQEQIRPWGRQEHRTGQPIELAATVATSLASVYIRLCFPFLIVPSRPLCYSYTSSPSFLVSPRLSPPLPLPLYPSFCLSFSLSGLWVKPLLLAAANSRVWQSAGRGRRSLESPLHGGTRLRGTLASLSRSYSVHFCVSFPLYRIGSSNEAQPTVAAAAVCV